MAGIVIIGAGQGAGQAAASLRQAKYEGDITLIGDEAYPPYQRPPLSKAYLSGELPIERVYVRAEKFYTDKNLESFNDRSAILKVKDQAITAINLDLQNKFCLRLLFLNPQLT